MSKIIKSAFAETPTLQSKINEASKFLGADIKTIEETLQKLGISDDAQGVRLLESDLVALEDLKWALFNILGGKEAIPFPEPKVKGAFLILKGKDPFDSDKDTKLPERVENWSDTQLLENYNIDSFPEINERLQKISNNRPFIVFKEGSNIDVETSLRLLRMSRRQPTPSTFVVDGDLKSVYNVGVFPLEFLYESPFDSGTILADGYCDVTGITFDTSDIEKLTFLRMINSHEKISTLEKRKVSELSLSELKKTFPMVAKKFEEAKLENQLPSLKRKLSKNPTKADPFRVYREGK